MKKQLQILAGVAVVMSFYGLTLVSAGLSLQAELSSTVVELPGLAQIFPVFLVLLTGLTFFGIVLMNQRLRQPAENLNN
mgnify:CR=1 FL=1